MLFHGFIHSSSILLNIINKYYYYNAMLCLIMLSSFSVNSVQQMCSVFCPFFPWSFWSSSTLPQLVVLRCIVLRFAVCFVLRCLVLCCDVMLCVVICLSFVTLVCWPKISQFSCSFVARLDGTNRRTYNGSISSTNSTT